MNSSKQAGMAFKPIIILLVGLILASVRLAEAQQPANVPHIGLLDGSTTSGVPAGGAQAWMDRAKEYRPRIPVWGAKA
jgi:hypothetical protein